MDSFSLKSHKHEINHTYSFLSPFCYLAHWFPDSGVLLSGWTLCFFLLPSNASIAGSTTMCLSNLFLTVFGHYE